VRYLSADYIFPISSAPVKDGILLLDEDQRIIDVLSDKQSLATDAEIEHYKGVLCPGFINAHCHLELSYLKNKIPQGKGLAGFIKDLIPARTASQEEILQSAFEADAEMQANGIVVVADISNTDASLAVKKASPIHYHTFIEIFDLKEEKAYEAFEKGKLLWNSFVSEDLSASIVPHAPYSVSVKLLKLINEFAYEHNSLLSIHNQETEGENEMFLTGKGKFIEELNEISGAYDSWKASGFRSLASVFVHLPKCNKIQFIHNTYSNKEDVRWAHLYNLFTWWCLCPKANLFIENKLPDIDMFRNEVSKITIGTDSYASNTSLSILDELKTIRQENSKIKLDELLRWATLNAAEFLGLHREYGSFEKGKRPGVNHLGAIDPESLNLGEFTFVRPLL
jgi:cytosine/adenosine deaminase-related metal-dependent hydrolase